MISIRIPIRCAGTEVNIRKQRFCDSGGKGNLWDFAIGLIAWVDAT